MTTNDGLERAAQPLVGSEVRVAITTALKAMADDSRAITLDELTKYVDECRRAEVDGTSTLVVTTYRFTSKMRTITIGSPLDK